jgi:hypothetical protein
MIWNVKRNIQVREMATHEHVNSHGHEQHTLPLTIDLVRKHTLSASFDEND